MFPAIFLPRSVLSTTKFDSKGFDGELEVSPHSIELQSLWVNFPLLTDKSKALSFCEQRLKQYQEADWRCHYLGGKTGNNVKENRWWPPGDILIDLTQVWEGPHPFPGRIVPGSDEMGYLTSQDPVLSPGRRQDLGQRLHTALWIYPVIFLDVSAPR